MKDVQPEKGEERGIGEISSAPSNSTLNGCENQIAIKISDSEGAQPSETTASTENTPAISPAIESENCKTNSSVFITITEIEKKLAKSESYHEKCRICHDLLEETLVDLGCGCRGELAKVHKSCIEFWFNAKGSNICEICQQRAVNIPPPKSYPGKNYWIWRANHVHGGTEPRNPENERRSDCPVWFGLCILIAGLLLDVFVSLSLGVSALPVNIVIGVLILLGLGTALRLGARCHRQWSMQRMMQRRSTSLDPPPPS